MFLKLHFLRKIVSKLKSRWGEEGRKKEQRGKFEYNCSTFTFGNIFKAELTLDLLSKHFRPDILRKKGLSLTHWRLLVLRSWYDKFEVFPQSWLPYLIHLSYINIENFYSDSYFSSFCNNTKRNCCLDLL